MANKYELGDLVRVKGVFANSSGTVADPANVFAQYRSPSGTTTSLAAADEDLVKESTGTYHVDIDADTVGTWHYRFYSTGDGQAADEGDFFVASSAFS